MLIQVAVELARWRRGPPLATTAFLEIRTEPLNFYDDMCEGRVGITANEIRPEPFPCTLGFRIDLLDPEFENQFQHRANQCAADVGLGRGCLRAEFAEAVGVPICF